jgi:hypothetical protein
LPPSTAPCRREKTILELVTNYSRGGFILNHKSTAVILFILYVILLGCMLTHQDMLAMWLMTFGMLIEASVNLYDQFKRR